MTDETYVERFYFSECSEIHHPQLPVISGLKKLASFDQKIDKLEIRRDRVCVSVGGMWHIVPVQDDK